MKALIILAVLLGLLMYGLIVATATANNKDTHEAYEKWKEKKHGKVD